MTNHPIVASRDEAELAAPLAFTGLGDGVGESVIDGTAPRSTGWVVAVLVTTAVTTARGEGFVVRRTRGGDGVGDAVREGVARGDGECVAVAVGEGHSGGRQTGDGEGAAAEGEGLGVAEAVSAVATPGTTTRTRHVAASSAAARRARSMGTRI